MDQTGTLLAAFFRFEPAVTLTVLAAGMSIDSPAVSYTHLTLPTTPYV